jgi:serine/threonine-protein kinase RsbW
MIQQTFRCQTSPRAPRKLAKAIRHFLSRHLVDDDVLYELELALTEACSNIVLYAYRNHSGGEIRVQVSLEPGSRLVIEIMDWGWPFYGPPANPPAQPDPRSETGRGIYLISQIMDTYRFSHSQQTNTLRMEKKLRSEHEVPGN